MTSGDRQFGWSTSGENKHLPWHHLSNDELRVGSLANAFLAYNHNYRNTYHILLEWSRALITFNDLSLWQLGYCALLPASHRESLYLNAIICYLGIDHAVRWIDDSKDATWLNVQNFLYPKTLSSDNFDYTFPAFLADFYGGLTESLAPYLKGQPSRRIYISRKDSKARVLLNEPEVESLMHDFGLEVITLTGLSATEMARIFADAQLIVSPHGAGLANLVFHRTPRIVVEIMPETYVNNCFRAISEGVCDRHVTVIGEVMDTSVPQKSLSYVVDLQSLESLMASLTSPLEEQQLVRSLSYHRNGKENQWV
jgi:capsular polysaccharide biosynthesis protein